MHVALRLSQRDAPLYAPGLFRVLHAQRHDALHSLVLLRLADLLCKLVVLQSGLAQAAALSLSLSLSMPLPACLLTSYLSKMTALDFVAAPPARRPWPSPPSPRAAAGGRGCCTLVMYSIMCIYIYIHTHI